MKLAAVSALAAGAAAFVIPDISMLAEIVIDAAQPAHAAADAAAAAAGAANLDAWMRDGVARLGRLYAETAATGADGLADELAAAADGVASQLLSATKETAFANQTLYQLLAASNTTTQFAALVDRFPALVARLNDTAVNSTVFVPADTAFAALPAGALNDTALAAALAHYHVANATVPYATMFNTRTVPSLVEEPRLGGTGSTGGTSGRLLQRLRLRFEKHLGLSVNFDAHVVAPNFEAANGVLHAVDALLAPPLPAAAALALAPTHFSTLALALNRTGLAADLDAAAGATVFAPNNDAFALLGPSINAFLFNSPVGLKYLRALLRCAVAPGATVYSDAYYGPADAVVVAPPVFAAPITRASYTLPTLLGGNATLVVNVTAVPGYVFMIANKAAVAIQDGIAQNGVIHEVGRVVLPPNATATLPWPDYKGVTTVPELVARLAPYMEDALPGDGDDAAAALPEEL